jgi:hypothetical protein
VQIHCPAAAYLLNKKALEVLVRRSSKPAVLVAEVHLVTATKEAEYTFNEFLPYLSTRPT